MSKYILDFEKPLQVIQDEINELMETSESTGVDVTLKVKDLEDKLASVGHEIYSNLSRWDRIQIARHPDRPHSFDYINKICEYWYEIHGDRKFADDKALITGLAIIKGVKFILIAQEKGRSTKEKLYRNFGMARPEGYRKSLRMMKLAEKFSLPIITIIDTPGAYPGIGAEERGQAQAIADNLFVMSRIKVPIISVVIGEGASGGALAIGLSDLILCQENSWYSVISPEGCASILFRDAQRSKEAADAMKVTSLDLYDMGIVDQIIKEPLGGAHNGLVESSKYLIDVIIESYNKLKNIDKDELIYRRMKKYESIGHYITNE